MASICDNQGTLITDIKQRKEAEERKEKQTWTNPMLCTWKQGPVCSFKCDKLRHVHLAFLPFTSPLQSLENYVVVRPREGGLERRMCQWHLGYVCDVQPCL